jgi:hypothetical protein
VPGAAPARHERARHRAARVVVRRVRKLPDAGFQLPDDRYSGGDRPRTAAPAAGDRGAPAGPGRALHRAARRSGRHRAAARTRMGPAATGKATRCGSTRPIRRPSCNGCSTTASPPVAA